MTIQANDIHFFAYVDDALEHALELIENGSIKADELEHMAEVIAYSFTPTTNTELRKLAEDDDDIQAECGLSPKRISRLFSEQLTATVLLFLQQHFPATNTTAEI
ncbi:hypothetical protein AWB71_05241 [Caballeronia peredens]|nr:hypothetical protein AWB71_05241 [Caballeronia peredens]